MKIKITDGPLKGQVVDIPDRNIRQGYVEVDKRPNLKNYKCDFHGPVVDAATTYIYRVEELWCNGVPTNRFVIKYEK